MATVLLYAIIYFCTGIALWVVDRYAWHRTNTKRAMVVLTVVYFVVTYIIASSSNSVSSPFGYALIAAGCVALPQFILNDLVAPIGAKAAKKNKSE